MNTRKNCLLPDGHQAVTPSQQAKAAGLKSLTQVSDLSGQSLNTLSNWARDKPKLFDVVLLGCMVKIHFQKD